MTNGPDLWGAEYARAGVPSSHLATPSGAVRWAFENIPPTADLRTAIDVGCGRGRNSLYMAARGLDVIAMDFCPTATQTLRQKIQETPASITVHTTDVTHPWPVAPHSADLAIDCFCFKHILLPAGRQAYRDEMTKALGPGGFYLLSCAGLDDGYYRLGPSIDEKGQRPGARAVLDPANAIGSVLYDPLFLRDFFGVGLDICAEVTQTKPGAMHGAVYERQTHWLLFQKR